MKIVGVIPSRYASTRFPGKPLIDIDGKSMIQRVYEQASNASLLSKVIVATDDSRIFEHVQKFGGEVVMTSPNHLNGTTRCNEVVSILEKKDDFYDVVINIQGDEPRINPQQIDNVGKLFQDHETEIGTLAKQIHNKEELFNPNVVKVVMDENNKALYFSRQAIPYCRDADYGSWLSKMDYYKHIGIYGYRTEILKRIVAMPIGKLEATESLEQLRWLENDLIIKVDITDFESIAIDTPEDLLKLETNP